MEFVLADCLYSCVFCWLLLLLHIYRLLFLCQLRSSALRPNLMFFFCYKVILILLSVLHSCLAFLFGIYLLPRGFIKVCYKFVLMFLLLPLFLLLQSCSLFPVSRSCFMLLSYNHIGSLFSWQFIKFFLSFCLESNFLHFM